MIPDDTARRLKRHGQGAQLVLARATEGMDAEERWKVEQLLLAYIADSVPSEAWSKGIDAGVRAVYRDRGQQRL